MHLHTYCTRTDKQADIHTYTPVATGNENVPKIIINDARDYFLTAICILLISNHNSFRVLFDKIASVYII